MLGDLKERLNANRAVSCASEALKMERINDFEKREPMEIGISCADLPDSVLAHEDGCVCVVQDVAGKMGKIREDLTRDLGVALCRNQEIKTGRCDQRCDELPCFGYIPWPPHHFWMRGDSKKFIKDRPGGVPGIGAGALTFQPTSAGNMKRRVRIGSVHQHIGIDDEHYRPSMAWYRASRSATSTNAPPLRNVGRGGIFSIFFRLRKSIRNAVSTSSDIVRPWRAASRFSCAMTVSSMFRVVFIWETISNVCLYVKGRL